MKEETLSDKNDKKTSNNEQYRNFKQIVNIFYNEEIDNIGANENNIILKNKGTIKIEPQIIYDKFSGDMKVEFKIGNKKMYKIKDLSEFYTKMLEKGFYKYGEKLQFVHTPEMFEKNSKELLNFILKYAEIIKYANSNANSNYRYYGKALSDTSIILGNSGIDDLFNVLKGKKVLFQKDYTVEEIELTEEQPRIEFKLRKKDNGQYEIIPNVDIYNVTIIKGKDYKYVLDGKKMYRCTKEFENSNIKLLELFKQNYMTELLLGKDELTELFSIVIPRVKGAIINENVPEEELEKYRPEELEVKVYLDFNKNDYLTAQIKFKYGQNEFNPLDEKIKIEFPRNMIQETKALNIFRTTGFMFDKNNLSFILPSDDKIYEFLSQDITYYMQKFEIMVTDKFKAKQVIQPRIGNIGIKIENDLLSIDLKGMNIDGKELQDIMSKYELKKKYYRLKDGSFIALMGNPQIDFLNKLATGMDIDYKKLANGKIELPVNRSLYLNKLLKEIKGVEVTRNSKYKEIINKLNKDQLEDDLKIPQNLENVLRYYQKVGFTWLKTLDYYKFGGILADDMGLGKTVQMLSIVVDYVENQNRDINMISGQELNRDINKISEQESNKDINSISENINEKASTVVPQNLLTSKKASTVVPQNLLTSKKASIVVSPSSLTLNWESEAKKFAPNLKTLVIKGNLQERKKQISEIEKYDLIITSYDLLKRDIELYEKKEYEFKYIIADEAQYLKNSSTQNAKAIKKIKAETRYALTGTPIENSLSELWSIFDFIMPGYLFTYRKFKATYETPIVKDENEEALLKLKMLIEPFILRRTKKEVLTELPEKTTTILNNEMEEEQRKIYLNYLSQAKKDIAKEIDINGFERSQMQILSAITRLRQICCHPSLFIENYKGECSKLDQCIEIIQDAVNGEHKILLFSRLYINV